MTPEAAFQLANTLVLPQWLLMVVAPRWRPTQWLMNTMLIPTGLAVMYVVYLFVAGSSAPAGQGLDFQSFSTLAGVMKLLGSGQPEAALAGWIHYLAFDLVAGSWVLRDSQARNIHHGFVVPCLFFCFMLGPIGLLLYGLVRLGTTALAARR
jgi:Domain of unknown function (DUF4281)